MIKLNGIEIKPTIFPDGTSQVWKIPKITSKVLNKIEWEFESEAEIMHLTQLCVLIEKLDGVVTDLFIPYFPYARQDKKITNETTFAKQVFNGFLFNLPNILKITTIDIHSSEMHYSSVKNIFPLDEINFTIEQAEPTLLAYPDKGAKERYGDFGDLPTCSFSKDRDQSTGHIKNLFLNELGVNIKDEDVLIIDDICDGGMTFKLTAEKLLQSGANSVSLYTTHGIYSKGIQTLKDSGISRIFNRKGEVFDEDIPTPPKGMIESELSNV